MPATLAKKPAAKAAARKLTAKKAAPKNLTSIFVRAALRKPTRKFRDSDIADKEDGALVSAVARAAAAAMLAK